MVTYDVTEAARLVAQLRLPNPLSRPSQDQIADQLEAAAAEIESLRTAMEVAQRAAERRGAARDELRAELARMRPVADSSVAMREAESISAVAIDEDAAAMPSRSDLYARALVAGQRTKDELDKWRIVVDAYRAGKP